MNLPVGKARMGRNAHESIGRDANILWKSSDLSSDDAADVTNDRNYAGIFRTSAVKPFTGMAGLQWPSRRVTCARPGQTPEDRLRP
jgi:hypothetical protein